MTPRRVRHSPEVFVQVNDIYLRYDTFGNSADARVGMESP